MLSLSAARKTEYAPALESVYELITNDHDWDSAMGLAVPPFFTMITQAHMKKYGTTKEQMGAVSVANYNYGFNNPNAHPAEKPKMDEYLVARTV